MKTKKVIASIILVLFIAPSVLAQQEENQLYYTVKRTVKPEKIDNYLDLSRKFAAACKEHNFPHSYSVWQSNIYDFYWFYPVSSYNSVKDVSAAAWEIVHKLEERFAAKFYENIEYEEDFFNEIDKS